MPMVRVSNGGTNSIVFLTEQTTQSYSLSYDVSSILPNYGQLTADNFFVIFTYVIGWGTGRGSDIPYPNFNVTISYDASTGIVSCPLGTIGSAGNYSMYIQSKARLYYTADPLPTT